MTAPGGAVRAGARRMVISQPAVICLETTTEHVRRVVSAFFGRERRSGAAVAAPPLESALATGPDGEGVETPGRRETVPLSAPERRARAAALRGLLLARQRRFPGAEAAFAEAIRLDPTFDPTTMPTFWDLERGGHEAVVGAFHAAGRPRDAEALAARLRRTYRPRLVRTPPGEVREPALG